MNKFPKRYLGSGKLGINDANQLQNNLVAPV